MEKRPNILLIYTDQQRYDTINGLGNKHIKTPNLNKLMSEGITFTHAIAPSPVSMPSRWSLHTGQWTSTHKCYSNHHEGPKPAYSLVQLLKDGGYYTGLSGKNHSFLKEEDFDYWKENPELKYDKEQNEIEKHIHEAHNKEYKRLYEEPVADSAEKCDERAKTDAAIDFIGSREEKPFFLWLSYLYPHTPYMAPEPYYSMYDDIDLPEPVKEKEGLEKANKPFRQIFHEKNTNAILPFTDEQIKRMKKTYYGMISFVDNQIGRLLKYLKEEDLLDNTLIIFTSDHGDYMGDHGLMTKSPALYDCLVRVPMIIKWKSKIAGGITDNNFVSHIDLLPTICSAADIPYPKEVEGINLMPYLLEPNNREEIRHFGYSEYGVPGTPYDKKRMIEEGLDNKRFMNPWEDGIPWEGNPVALSGRIFMYRNHEYKYVEEPSGTNELYDLVNDPYELENIYDENIHRKLIEKIKRTDS